MRAVANLILASLVLAAAGCSLRHVAVDHLGNALAEGGAAFSADDDPELVRAAAPFSLKLVESLLDERPQHRGLLLAATRGFTQYGYAFLQQDAEEAEDRSMAESRRLEERARRLYRRARDYGVRGLSLGRPGFERALQADPKRAVAAVQADDVGLLYWTAAAWGALIGVSKHDPEALADLPIVEALIDRALELDECYERGAIHTLLIGYEAVRLGAPGDPAGRARRHFVRAMEISGGGDAAPLVALAEAVSVPQQHRGEFEALLKRALELDVDRDPSNRLANLVAQRRARWLLARTERLFTD
jgi:predicted anti-sigma-YlaC factor YlaD